MFKAGEIKKLLVRIGLTFAAFNSSAWAIEENLIIPQVCVERAKQIGIFHNKKLNEQTAEKLRHENSPWQVYDYEAIVNAYENTLSTVSSQLGDYKSSIFQHLIECRNNERTCHGWFKPSNAFHVQIFCDPKIAIATLNTVETVKKARFDRCHTKSGIITSEELLENPNIGYDKTCFEKKTEDGETYLINKSVKYLKELEYLDAWQKKIAQFHIHTVEKALVPEAIDYIYLKVDEEFKDVSIRSEKVSDLNLYYLKGDLVNSLAKCCETKDMQTFEGSSSMESLARAAQKLALTMNQHDAITFRTADFLSDLVFDEAEAQFWRDKFQTQSPLNLSVAEKEEYFLYLKKNPYFYADTTATFSSFVAETKKHDRSEYALRLPSEEDMQRFDEYDKQYRTQRGYVPKRPFETYTIPLNDEQQVINQFLFDPTFQRFYMHDLTEEKKSIEHERFEKGKGIYHPRIFQGFLPYQFIRVSQARIVRELQKKTKSQADIILSTFDTFHKWADKVTCGGQEHTYCKVSDNTFREAKHMELYDNLIAGVIPMTYVAGGVTRTSIYTDNFLDGARKRSKDELDELGVTESFFNGFNLKKPDPNPYDDQPAENEDTDGLNIQIKLINHFCWQNTNAEMFKKDKKSFVEKSKILDSKMKAFYSTPRFEEVLGQNAFIEAAKFNPTKYAEQCFTEGYVFGDALEPSAEGLRVVRSVYVGTSTPGIPLYSEVQAKDDGMLFQQAYKPSAFRFKPSIMLEVEESIEERISEEFSILKKAYEYTPSQQEDFLEESATTRLLAMVDYALANPSGKVGDYICELIKQADTSIYQHEQLMQFIRTAIIVAVGTTVIFSFVTLGVGAVAAVIGAAEVSAEVAGMAVFFNNTLMYLSVAGIGLSLYEIKDYNNANNSTDMSVLAHNIPAETATLLHLYYGEKISEKQKHIAYNLVFLLISGIRPAIQGFKELRLRMDNMYVQTLSKRKERIENLLERTPETTIHNAEKTTIGTEKLVERVAESQKFKLADEIKQYVYNYKKVGDKQFEDFMDALRKGEGENYIRMNWRRELERYLPPIPKIEPRPITELVKSEIPVLLRPIEDVLARPMTMLFVNRYTFKLKQFFERVFKIKLRPALGEYEDWKVSILQRAQKIKADKNITIFTEAEIVEMASKMKRFRYVNGKFYRVLDETMESTLKTLMKNNVAADAQEGVRQYLQPLVHSNLLSESEWTTLMKHMKTVISDLDDCKDLLKYVKVMKREYGFWEQFGKRFTQAWSWRDISGPFAYNRRFDLMVRDIDNGLSLSKYVRYKNNVALVDNLKAAINQEGKTIYNLDGSIQQSGKSIDEIDAAIREFDKDFSFARKLSEYQKQKAFIESFDLKTALTKSGIKDLETGALVELTSTEAELLRKFKEHFLRIEARSSNTFDRRLTKSLAKGKDVITSYRDALFKAQHVKQTNYECSLPSTQVRLEANKAYKKTASYISLGSTAYGYWLAHNDENIDAEWLARLSYEVLMGQVGAYFQSNVFTNSALKGGGPLYKLTREWFYGSIISTFDAIVYRGAGKLLDSREELEKEFKDLIYQSPDPKKTIEEFFNDHPDVRDQILERLKKMNAVFEEIQVRNSKGDMVDSEMEDMFIRAGLIDDILYSDMKLKDRELGENYLYHDLINDGLVDEDLYRDSKTNDELEEQIMELLADIKYKELYDNKSGELKLPLLDPIVIGDGDIDRIEFDTGSEMWDRALFYPLYDASKNVVAYPKNYAVYWLLCNARNWPGNTNVYAALALHLVYKTNMDAFKFWLREQATGR